MTAQCSPNLFSIIIILRLWCYKQLQSVSIWRCEEEVWELLTRYRPSQAGQPIINCETFKCRKLEIIVFLDYAGYQS